MATQNGTVVRRSGFYRLVAPLLFLASLVACTTPSPWAAAPEILSLSAEPPSIALGESTTLSWEVVGASALRLLPDDVDVAGLSSFVVTPEVTTTYTLRASNAFGTKQEAVSVTLNGATATIASFELVSGIANPGLDATLRWRVDDADEVELRGPGLGEGTDSGIVVPADSQRVVTDLPPGATFTLLAKNPYGVVEAHVVAARDVPAFSVLVAGQSNVIGRNVSNPWAALAAIQASTGVTMLGYDYRWKNAYEPLFDCTGQIDLDQSDVPEVGCSSFDQNDAGVSPGVSMGNAIAAATGGDVYLIPRARGATGAYRWLPSANRYDRSTLFGSAAFRAQLAQAQRGAPLGYGYDGKSYGAIVWYQGEANTSTLSRTVTFAQDTPVVLDALQEELGAPIFLVQLSRRGEGAVERNLNYQIVREQQRRYATDARTPSGSVAGESRAATHLIVTHDLPMVDDSHLSIAAQLELGRRLSLAAREHLLGEAVDGTGPRLVSVEMVSPSIVRVHTDRPITEPSSSGPEAYGGYFAIVAGGVEQSIATIERDPTDPKTVRITLVDPVPDVVSVRYMPPPVTLSGVAADVIRSADCTEPMPRTSLCLPMAAFGTAMDTATASTLRFFVDEDDVPEGY